MAKLTVAHVNLARGFRGGERQTEILISQLAKMGVNQIFICRTGSPMVEHLNSVAGLEIIELNKIIDLRLCGHKLLSRRCDLIQAHETRAAQWAYVHFKLYGVPYVVTRRVPEPVGNNFFNRGIYKRAIALVSVSKCIASYLRKEFGVNVEVIPDAASDSKVNHENVRNLKIRFKDRYVIGHVGALVDKHKGQSTLIRAALLLKQKIPGLQVLFLGAGKDGSALKKVASELLEDNEVSFEGFVDNVVDYLQVMNIFAYPSNYEGLGSVLLDVMEQGVPVVASNVGGIPEIIQNEKTGLLVESGDEKVLASAILRVYESKKLRCYLVQEARKLAVNYSPSAMAEKYFNLYLSRLKINFSEDCKE